MEILQTIWTALTTPNEGLINIISIPLAFLDAYIGMIFFSACLNIKSSRKQKIIYVCTFSVLALIINMVLPNLYSTFDFMANFSNTYIKDICFKRYIIRSCCFGNNFMFRIYIF